MQNVVRKFEASVKITRPDYNSMAFSETVIVNFVSHHASNDRESTDMVGYSFEESISDIEAGFSLTLMPTMDKDDRSWVDKIAPMDIVSFKEFGKTRYVGVVHEVRYVAQMGQTGPRRVIVVAGAGFGHLISGFSLVLDAHLWLGGPTADSISTTLSAEIAEKGERKLKNVLKIIWDSFIKLAVIPGDGDKQCGVFRVIESYIDADSGISSIESLYELAIGLYQVGENNIWQIFQSILPAPLYECFGRWSAEAEKYQVIIRQTPFDTSDWKKLPTTRINPIVLTDYSVGKSDREVKTFFFGELPGSSISKEMILSLPKDYKATRAKDSEKWPKYGYKPMSVTFRYFKRDAETSGEQQVLQKVAARLLDWYSKNDEFLSGEIQLIGIDDSDVMGYPRIGEKVSFIGCEFYVEATRRTWTYGESPKVVLSVTRGYVYNSDGSRQGQVSGLGKRLMEAEGVGS